MARDIAAGIPPVVIPHGTSRHGLVIGIDKYVDARLNLRFAAADARAVRDLMVDPECGCFPSENVQLLLDDEATTKGVFQALARLRRRASDDDVVWIYYAGHAAVQDQAYWVTHDADVDDLFATALGSDRIESVLSQVSARRVLMILDCCHAEATALRNDQMRQVVTADELFGRFKGYGTITLAASDGRQRSVELAEFGHGAFTYFLEKGLRGEADTDGDGIVTADELWVYLRGKVTQASRAAGNPQTPMLIGTMTHDVALTLNAAATARKLGLKRELEKLVGLRADQLSTDEGRFCQEIIERGAHTTSERSLLESLEELIAGQLTPTMFRRLAQMAYAATRGAVPALHTQTNLEPAAPVTAEVLPVAEAERTSAAPARPSQPGPATPPTSPLSSLSLSTPSTPSADASDSSSQEPRTHRFAFAGAAVALVLVGVWILWPSSRPASEQAQNHPADAPEPSPPVDSGAPTQPAGRRAEPDPASTYAVPIDGDPVDGPADAKVTLVKAYDYACPFCAQDRTTMDDLRKRYANDLRIVYKQFVVHPQVATAAALAACAANKQGKFLAFDRLLWDKGFAPYAASKNPSSLGEDNILEIAQGIGLNTGKIKADMKGECQQRVQDDMRDLVAIGVNATPTFFINGRYLRGARPIDAFTPVIDDELKKATDRIAAGTPAARYYELFVLDRGLRRATR